MQARIIDTRTKERKAITGDGIDLSLAVHEISNKRERDSGENLRSVPTEQKEKTKA